MTTISARIKQHIESLGLRCRGPQRDVFLPKDFRPGVLAQKLSDLLGILGAQPRDAVRPYLFALLYVGPFPFTEEQKAAFTPDELALAVEVQAILEAMPADVSIAERQQFAADLDQYLRGAGCGYDVGAIILANPLDGDEHTYECPRCKVKGTYRAPVEAVLEAELEHAGAEA